MGGSFNPAHAGHRHISVTALARFDLDQVWWLVSRQNPLKSASHTAPFDQRLSGARALARHPRIIATDLENRLGARFTADTLAALRRYYPRTRFVWIMGADNLGQIHRWRRWRSIFETTPVAAFDRPTYGLRALAGPAAMAFRRFRVAGPRSRRIARSPAPAWVFVRSRLDPRSSTQIRAAKIGADALPSGVAVPT